MLNAARAQTQTISFVPACCLLQYCYRHNLLV